MAILGDDFKRARREWLYPAAVMQSPWRAVPLSIFLFVLSAVLQLLAGFLAYSVMRGEFSDNSISNNLGRFSFGFPSDQDLFTKASIIGLFPAAILILAIAVYFSRFGLPKMAGRLTLQIPKLGWLGWIIIVVGFGVSMSFVFAGTMAALGIDPETYSPSGGGVTGDNSSAGIVEKTMAALAKDPVLFAFALPSVVLAAPLTEELLFRGALFSAIASSRLGRVGAVLITAALWALAHATSAPWLFVGMLFVMGICLGVLLLRFGSLWVTIACHASWNAMSSLALFGAGTQL